MANCNDCIHYKVCCQKHLHVITGMDFVYRYKYNHIERVCKDFKDRSRFVELSHAEWVEDEDICNYLIYRCSNCNERFVLEEGTPLDNCYFYCPNCGAKMDEQALKEREEND